jgi:hypothetical protein
VKLHFRMCIIKFNVQPLPDLRKGCGPWNCKQVEFYVDRISLNSIVFLLGAQDF